MVLKEAKLPSERKRYTRPVVRTATLVLPHLFATSGPPSDPGFRGPPPPGASQ